MRPIDADALKKSIKEDEKLKSSSVAYLLMNLMTCYIDEAQTIDVEPVRHGRWIKMYSGYACSECYCPADDENLSDFCPDCGAKMMDVVNKNEENNY